MEQKSLFNVLDFGDAPKQKRVHYKIPKFSKTYREDINTNDLSLWGRLNNVCTHLSNFFPIPLPIEQKNYYDKADRMDATDNELDIYGIIRVWVDIYTQEAYTYGDAIYQGQEFKVIQAEIIGTENLSPEKRLYIHELLLERLENNEKEPFFDIDKIIEELKDGDCLE